MFKRKERDEEVKLNDAWEWFRYFEFQRSLGFFAFFALAGALFAICFNVFMSGRPSVMWLIPVASFVGIIISVAFIFLDIRNTELEFRGLSELRKFEFDPAFENPEDFQEAVHSLKGEPERLKEKWIKEAKTIKPLIGRSLWFRTIYIMGFSISTISLIIFTSLDLYWLLLIAYFILMISISLMKWRRRESGL